MAHVFTYGSLMFPRVWSRVVCGVYRSSKAVAEGHQRSMLRGEIYPAMVARAGQCVEGVVYLDVDAADLARLDAFEGKDYRRSPLKLRLENGESLAAETYLYLRIEQLTDTPWEPSTFDEERFLAAYPGWSWKDGV
jgi:gamma-glutamylcyclotransferase (GGCT)/AIG2-like uncharacterized protein YtfP